MSVLSRERGLIFSALDKLTTSIPDGNIFIVSEECLKDCLYIEVRSAWHLLGRIEIDFTDPLNPQPMITAVNLKAISCLYEPIKAIVEWFRDTPELQTSQETIEHFDKLVRAYFKWEKACRKARKRRSRCEIAIRRYSQLIEALDACRRPLEA